MAESKSHPSGVVKLGAASAKAVLKSVVASLKGGGSARVVLTGEAAQLKSVLADLSEKATVRSVTVSLKETSPVR